MANKQLKIWKDDLRRYYNKTTLMMRVIIGAVLSALFAYYVVNKVVKPQNALNSKLKDKLMAMEEIEDVGARVADLKNEKRKAENRLEGIQEANETLYRECGNLSRSDVGRLFLEVRGLMDKNELRITSEMKSQTRANVSYRRRDTSQKKVNPPVKIVFPDSMGYDTQVFSVLGSYVNIQNFLLTIHESKRLLFLDNIKIRQSGETLTDRDLNPYRALSCDFEVHIPYLKEEVAKEKVAKK